MNKKILLISPLIILMAACSGGGGSQTSSGTTTSSSSSSTTSVRPIDPDFDEDHIILKAPVFSDEHCERTSPIDSAAQTTAGIKKFMELVDEDTFDIWLTTGDRSLTGTTAADEKWLNAYKAGSTDAENKLFFCHGNHDVYWQGCASREEHYNWFNTNSGVYTLDANDSSPSTGNRHAVVNGIHFVAIDVQTYMPKQNNFSASTKAWFKEVMDAAYAADPLKPIIVLCHCPAFDTSTGSLNEQYDGGYWGGSKELNTLLADYPNAILLSGHTHYEVYDERAIMSTNNFTSVTVPTLSGGSSVDLFYNGIFDPLYDMEGSERKYKPSGVVDGLPEATSYKSSSAMYLEIDNKGATRISRWNLQYGREVKAPWVIPAPKADGSHLNKYSARNRMRNDMGPEFPSDGTVSVRNDNGKITLRHTPFTHDDMIYAYEYQIFEGKDIVEVGDFDEPTERYVFFDQWYKKELPALYSYQFSGKYNDKFCARVVALDVWGKYSFVWGN